MTVSILYLLDISVVDNSQKSPVLVITSHPIIITIIYISNSLLSTIDNWNAQERNVDDLTESRRDSNNVRISSAVTIRPWKTKAIRRSWSIRWN